MHVEAIQHCHQHHEGFLGCKESFGSVLEPMEDVMFITKFGLNEHVLEVGGYYVLNAPEWLAKKCLIELISTVRP